MPEKRARKLGLVSRFIVLEEKRDGHISHYTIEPSLITFSELIPIKLRSWKIENRF